jgi:hypothetical protein
MEQFSGLLLTSIAVGGSVFAAFIIVWFVAVSLKRRASRLNVETMSTALPQASGWEEKRREMRLTVSWRASVSRPPEEQPAQIRDISLGGAFVACPGPLPLGEGFEITIHPPHGDPLQMHAEVVWSNANVPADRVVHRGMGIRFSANDSGKRKQLAEATSLCLTESPTPAAKAAGVGTER